MLLKNLFLLLLTALLSWSCCTEGRLTVNGTNFYYNNEKVFLSGVNGAWVAYGYDFGNRMYEYNANATTRQWFTRIAAAGGNSIRFWLHVEGFNTPTFDADGFVTGLDTEGTMISDMREFLDVAQSHDIVVIFSLFNGAVMKNENVINLFLDDAKLDSYIQNALKPMVAALSDHPALGAWEVMNEPEGSVLISSTPNPNPCFDTAILTSTYAGWTGANIPMQNFLRASNWLAQGVKEVNSASLITQGAWCELVSTDSFSNSRNYWKDSCLLAAGGKPLGKLDFYQMHTYADSVNVWQTNGPFKVASASAYALDKPVVIGEFSAECSAKETIEQLYDHAYTNGFQGAWTWQYVQYEGNGCADSQETQDAGMLSLKGRNGVGGLVNFPVAKK